jgi:hypothetical protein
VAAETNMPTTFCSWCKPMVTDRELIGVHSDDGKGSIDSGNFGWTVQCFMCGMRGPIMHDKKTACMAWDILSALAARS